MNKLLFLFLLIFSCMGKAHALAESKFDFTVNFSQAAEMAVSASAELRNAHAEYEIAKQSWSLGIMKFFPRLSFTFSENDRLQQLGADSFAKSYAVNIDQLLWDGGKTSMARSLQRMELNAVSSRLDRMASEIAEAALGAYRSVLSSRAVLSIRESALETLAGQRRILAGEVSLGLALAVDLAEADLAIAEAEIEIITLRSDLAEMELQFAEILGLDSLPELSEMVDIRRSAFLPGHDAVASLATERNPELSESRISIVKRLSELKYAGRAWLPTFRLQGSFGLNGSEYPLTRYSWSLGLNVELAGAWLQNNFGFQAGFDPPHDRSAQLQNSAIPVPNPEMGLSKRQAQLALALEQEKYRIALDRMDRTARRGVEKCAAAERMRELAVQAVTLAGERLRLEELRLSLGHITRIDLMEAIIEYTKKEITAVNVAISLLEAERELERFMDMRPGELVTLTNPINKPKISPRSTNE